MSREEEAVSEAGSTARRAEWARPDGHPLRGDARRGCGSSCVAGVRERGGRSAADDRRRLMDELVVLESCDHE